MKKTALAILLALTAVASHAASALKTFTTHTQSGPVLYVPAGESFDYSVSGTFVGVVKIERSDNGTNYETTGLQFSTGATGNHINDTRKGQAYRVYCTTHTSGSIVTSLSDVTDQLQEFKNRGGVTVLRILDNGIAVPGTLTAGTIVGPVSGPVSVSGVDLSTVTTALSAKFDNVGGTITGPVVMSNGNLSAGTTGLFFNATDTITWRLDGSRIVELRQFNTIGSSNSMTMVGTSYNGSAPVGTGYGVVGRSARGVAEAPVALTTGDAMFAIGGLPFDGTNFRALTSVRQSAVAEEPQTPTAQGGGWIWDTTAVGGTSRTQKMVLKGNGNLGIGTTTPPFLLSAASGTLGMFAVHGTSVAMYAANAIIQGRAFGGGSFVSPTAISDNIGLIVLGGTGFDGTTYPSGGSATPGVFIIRSSGAYTTGSHGSFAQLLLTPINTTASIEVMRVTDSGAVGIGTTTPRTKLDVNGSASFGSDVTKSTFTATGALTLASGASLTVSSAAFMGVSYSTQASAGVGAATTVTCPAGSFAEYGGCDCTGIVGATDIINRPNSVTAGSLPTGHTCQSVGATGGDCAAFVRCSVVQ